MFQDYLGSIYIGIGLYLCLLSSRFQEQTLSLFGSSLGAYIVYTVSLRIQFAIATQITLTILMSLLFAVICMKCVRFSVTIIAVIHALCISNLMAPGLGHVWGSVVNYAALIILPSLFLYAPDVGVLVSSSFFGAWIVVVGIEQYIGTGFPDPYMVLFNRNWDQLVTVEESAFLECLLVCSIMITSLIIQIRHVENVRERQYNEILKQIEEHLDNVEKVKNIQEKSKLDEEQIVGEENINKAEQAKIIYDSLVTPDGEDHSINISDTKTYFIEKFIGSTESSKPLL